MTLVSSNILKISFINSNLYLVFMFKWNYSVKFLLLCHNLFHSWFFSYEFSLRLEQPLSNFLDVSQRCSIQMFSYSLISILRRSLPTSRLICYLIWECCNIFWQKECISLKIFTQNKKICFLQLFQFIQNHLLNRITHNYSCDYQ